MLSKAELEGPSPWVVSKQFQSLGKVGDASQGELGSHLGSWNLPCLSQNWGTPWSQSKHRLGARHPHLARGGGGETRWAWRPPTTHNPVTRSLGGPGLCRNLRQNPAGSSLYLAQVSGSLSSKGPSSAELYLDGRLLCLSGVLAKPSKSGPSSSSWRT